MDKTENKKKTASVNAKYKKQLGTVFNSLPEDVRASSRRLQFLGGILLETMIENGVYSTNPLCTKKGLSALKNALKFYNVGVSALSDALMSQRDAGSHTANEGYRAHVNEGVKIVEDMIDFSSLSDDDAFYWGVLRDTVAQHHERWDGTGYPNELTGGMISLAARICTVCDWFDFLTTSDGDRDKMTVEAAFDEINKYNDTFFDPIVVEAFGKSLDKINEAIDSGALSRASSGQKSVRSMEQLYRIVYDYNNRLTYGYETDIRLNDKELGVISSDVFIPVAEKSSKINEIIKWSVEQACEDVVALHKRGRFTGIIFINMSVKALIRKNFVENVARIIKGYELPFDSFCFTISENMLSLETEKVREAIDKLRGLGFLVAIGGFGTEYSNLSAFQELDVDYIMLEKEFVSGILTSIRSKKITESIVELSNRLDTLVIADGVSTKEEADALFAMGCALMRGNRFGRFTDYSGI